MFVLIGNFQRSVSKSMRALEAFCDELALAGSGSKLDLQDLRRIM